VCLYLVSLLEHARVWLAEDRKRRGDTPQALPQTEAMAA